MWICEKCETSNQGSKCQVCGSLKPAEPPVAPAPAEKPRKEKKQRSVWFWIILIGIIGCVCAAAFIAGVMIDDPKFILHRGVNFLKRIYHAIF